MPSAGAIQTAIRVTASLIGAAAAGPLGAALGGMASAALAKPTEDLAKKSLEKLLDLSADQLAARFDAPSPTLQSAYRNALQQSLATLAPQASLLDSDWFRHWNLALTTASPLDLAPLTPSDLQPAALDTLLRRTLETLDAQGRALQQQSLSLTLPTRPLPEDLFTLLATQLPPLFEPAFRTLLTKPAYAQAWTEAQQHFQDWLTTTLTRIDATTQRTEQKLDALPAHLEDIIRRSLAEAIEAGRVLPIPDPRTQDAEVARLTEELVRVRAELASRPADREARQLKALVDSGNLTAAAALKQQQIEAREAEAARLPSDYFELGQFHELRFDWPHALTAYQKAWQLSGDSDHGFKYAVCARHQNDFAEALRIYELLRDRAESTGNLSGFANVQQNLAMLYDEAQRDTDAETAYAGALSTYVALAQTEHRDYRPEVAMTLCNLGNFYSRTGQTHSAEIAYLNALSIRTTLAEEDPESFHGLVAETRNNLAVMYVNLQRMEDAAEQLREALSIWRALAVSKPDAFLPSVATALNNLAVIYRQNGWHSRSEDHLKEALEIRRALAAANPDAFSPDVAHTLLNLGNLYSVTGRLLDSEKSYRAALALQKSFAIRTPAVFMPEVARTLNNLAALYRETGRIGRALVASRRASKALTPFWQQSPARHGDMMARILWLEAVLRFDLSSTNAESFALANLALHAAQNPGLKEEIQDFLNHQGVAGAPSRPTTIKPDHATPHPHHPRRSLGHARRRNPRPSERHP